MAGDLKSKYGTSNQTITITLNSLTASATVGRSSAALDNTSNLFEDVLIAVKVTVGTVSGNKQVLVWAYGTADGGTSYTEGNSGIGTDASYTRNDPTALRLLGVIPCPTNSIAYTGHFWLSEAFRRMPDHWGIVVCNDTGASLAASGNSAHYQGILGQYT